MPQTDSLTSRIRPGHALRRPNGFSHPVSVPQRKEAPLFEPLSQYQGQPSQGKPFSTPKLSVSRNRRRRIVYGGLFLLVGAFTLLGLRMFSVKELVIQESEKGYEQLSLAVIHLKEKQYPEANVAFDRARASFEAASAALSFPFDWVLEGTRFVPGLSVAASGKHAIEAGRYFSLAGKPLTALAESALLSKEAYDQGEKVSLIELMRQAREPISQAKDWLSLADTELQAVSLTDIPEGKQGKFLTVRSNLPVFLNLLKGFEKNEKILEELLGENGPRTYLFLLQNNQEMRATGGFIGTYALVDVNQGVIRRFFVDGIFNPDGQLKENIVPPKPIQKISAGWSLHDSNWFPDFPTSAEKAIFFYEKTGGPTVDGVITLTPTVMQKLLAVIGSISLPQYGLTVDAENFIPVIQEQVEVKYDKELNEPKKVLVDLSRALVERVFSLQDRSVTARLAEALTNGLNEKHILMYMRHKETEQLIDEVGWSGRMLDTAKDYLSVIHSNINGYKTDGVIEEQIKHHATLAEDGSIIDTVTITRHHKGGDTPYDWWNRVNADYLRVYVPKGSELISTKGTTWEFPEAPLDYDRLGFRRDPMVEHEENNTVIDEKSGVRISEDANKTVFGAWVYVSPKESVTVEYQYRLPFRIDMTALKRGAVDSYSILVQKQSGSLGSILQTEMTVPDTVQMIWQTEPNLVPYGRTVKDETSLVTDIFRGVVLEHK